LWTEPLARQDSAASVALDKDGKTVCIRIPYTSGLHAKGFGGRIDDPNAGWKGRGRWAANGNRTPWQI